VRAIKEKTQNVSDFTRKRLAALKRSGPSPIINRISVTPRKTVFRSAQTRPGEKLSISPTSIKFCRAYDRKCIRFSTRRQTNVRTGKYGNNNVRLPANDIGNGRANSPRTPNTFSSYGLRIMDGARTRRTHDFDVVKFDNCLGTT